jgi:uncharacterized membrane protein
MNCSENSRRAAGLAAAALGVAYPFLVYAGLGHAPAGLFVLAALALVALRLAAVRRGRVGRALAPALAAVAAATLLAWSLDPAVAAQAYPVLMSLGMAAAFGWSLRHPPSLIELFARLAEPDPDAAARAYMRRVTLAWCAVLLLNAGLSALSVLHGDLALWTLYNGLVSYLLMGLMFVGEYALRRWLRRRRERAA